MFIRAARQSNIIKSNLNVIGHTPQEVESELQEKDFPELQKFDKQWHSGKYIFDN